MKNEDSSLPSVITLVAAVIIFVGIVGIRVAVAAETLPATAPDDRLSVSKEVFQWIVAAAGLISLVFSIGYGFFKKQKYDNILKDRDEWEGVAKSREERIKELKYVASEIQARHELAMNECRETITDTQEINKALVSQSLQMRAILRELRLSGQWPGHEDRIYEDRR